MRAMRIFRTELKRLCDSGYLIYGILGICLYMLTLRIEDPNGGGTMYILQNTMDTMGFVLVIMMGYEVYGNVFLDDFKHKYIYQILLREHNIFLYTVRKTFFVFVSAMLCVALGVVLFVLVVRLRHPWSDELTAFMVYTPFGKLYKNENYIMYTLASGLQFGVLAGMMSMLGSAITMFIPNKVFAGAITIAGVMTCNFLKGYFWHTGGSNIFALFTAFYNDLSLGNDWIVHCIILGLLFYGIGTIIIYLRIRWRIRHE